LNGSRQIGLYSLALFITLNNTIQVVEIMKYLIPFLIIFNPTLCYAGEGAILGKTNSFLGWVAVGLFVLAYVAVIAEEYIHLRKSKPVILAAGLIWTIVAIMVISKSNDPTIQKTVVTEMKSQISHTLVEFAELFLFLLVAMTYINAMTSRKVFDSLKCYLVNKGYTYRSIFWITGLLSFVISPIADNLTTALLMATVVSSLGENKKFLTLAYINIVVAANAGGAFSPFGDITTLMVWQAEKLDFLTFFKLLLPSVVNFIIPAIIMSFALPKGKPEVKGESIVMMRGAKRICFFFILTLAISICFKQFLHLPPFFGMMTGVSILFFFGYYLRLTGPRRSRDNGVTFNIFDKIEKAEWDTLFFFFGVIFCVGGLAYIGYLELASTKMYSMGFTVANVFAGVLSAFVDNIPVMLGILTMNPEMGEYQWLLITLTAAVGGSILSVGSAAGVALMGQSKGAYTFVGHLKWSWCIAIGYACSIYCHYLINY
jgi:Na+/H+ antiporter NhaD/arsenite permease-like protein